MNITILDDYEKCCARIAGELAALTSRKPEALLCLAAGHSSLGVFDAMAAMQESREADFSHVYIVGLDEWSGKAEADDGSCSGFLHRNCFDRLPIPPDHIRLFDGRYTDAKAECRAVERYIEERGGIDYMLLGIGMNGHLALNEPGTPFAWGAHETELSETTKTVGQKYFAEQTALAGGITLGIRNILDSRRIVLLINGEHKRPVLSELLRLPVTTSFPATVLKSAPNAEIVTEWACVEKPEGLNLCRKPAQGPVVGVDVGGTKTLLIIQQPDGEILAEEWTDSPKTPEGLGDFIESAIAKAGLEKQEVKALAMGIPGLVNAETEVVQDAPGLGWKSLCLKEKLFGRFPFPCGVRNDITMALIAERSIGKARGASDVVFLAIGTGLGCAILSNGRIVEGSTGSAGEIGYWMSVQDAAEERVNQEGHFGPLEEKVSGSALQKLSADKTPRELLLQYDRLAGEEKQAVDAFIRALAVTIANIISLLNPQKVILGGGVSESLDRLLPLIREKVAQYNPIPTQLEISDYHNRAGALGACCLAMQMQQD
ncbi:MAG TPA: ROK family protein [Firmicutes bacterium]|nr:ROK family protein [Bacillota bacterium]